MKVIASHGRLNAQTGHVAKGGRFADNENLGEEVVTLRAVNMGHKVLTIDQAGIELKSQTRLAFTRCEAQLPHELGPGQQLSFWSNAGQFSGQTRASAPSFPYFRDASDRMYKGSFDEYFKEWMEERLKERERN